MQWNRESILELIRGFQRPAVLAAAVRLDVFTAIGQRSVSAADLAGRLSVDLRGLRILLDALAAMDLLAKQGDLYAVPDAVRGLLSRDEPGNVYHGVDHTAVLLPRWAHLPETIRTGTPWTLREDYQPQDGALESFIEAMHVFSLPAAADLVERLPLGGAKRLLDVGGGPGTWTIAFCRKHPALRAVLFDRPQVTPIAERHIREEELADRVEIVAGSFLEDELPAPADVAWVSAIIHMLGRGQIRELFAKVARALDPGGRIWIRDYVMDPTRTVPASGAMFAVNMLSGTAEGDAYTFEEIREDIESAGFEGVELLIGDAEMNCVVGGSKPT